jgi:hypothetical protein
MAPNKALQATPGIHFVCRFPRSQPSLGAPERHR